MSPRRLSSGRARATTAPFGAEGFFLLQARDNGTSARFAVRWDDEAGTVYVPGAGPFSIDQLAERWRQHGLPLVMQWHDDIARGYHVDGSRLWLQERFDDPDGWPQQPASDLAECASYVQPPAGRNRCGQRTLWRDADNQPCCPSPFHEST
jgi:hypothetical protein